MNAIKKVDGIMWDNGVVCNAKWSGYLLRDILISVGLTKEAKITGDKHVCFESRAVPTEKDDWYGASIPLTKALDPKGDVLLATHVRCYINYLSYRSYSSTLGEQQATLV